MDFLKVVCFVLDNHVVSLVRLIDDSFRSVPKGCQSLLVLLCEIRLLGETTESSDFPSDLREAASQIW